MVIVAGVESYPILVERLSEDIFGLGLKLAASDVDDAFLALEGSAAFVLAGAAAALDHGTAAVFEGDLERLRSFEELFGVVRCRALDFDRAAVIHAQSPLDDVEVMGAPVGHLSPGVIPEKAEQVVDAVLVVGPQRGRAEPHIVIEFRRGLAVRNVGRIALLFPVYAGETDFDRLDLAEAARADVFAGLQELGGGPLLASGLQDAFAAAHGLHERLAFSDEKRERLLAIHVLAGFAGVNGGERVPVVGRAD